MTIKLPGLQLKQLFLEAITLQTPRGRLFVWAILTTAIFFSRYSWLENLSLWQMIGFDSAPSIGLTRSYWLLLHGDVAAAWERNPLIFAVLAVGLPILLNDLRIVINDKLRTTAD